MFNYFSLIMNLASLIYFELRTIVSYEPEETATTEELVNDSFKVSFIQNL